MIKKIAQVVGDRIVEYYSIAAEHCNDIIVHQLTKDLADDLDTPKTLATWYAMLDVMNDEVIKAMLYVDNAIMKIGLYEGVVDYLAAQQAPEEIIALAKARWEAKAAKDWGRADELRGELDEKGWVMNDGKD